MWHRMPLIMQNDIPRSRDFFDIQSFRAVSLGGSVFVCSCYCIKSLGSVKDAHPFRLLFVCIFCQG